MILALNGRPVDSSNDLRNHIAPLGPGAKVSLRVVRDGKEREVSAVLAERQVEKAAAAPGAPESEHGRYGMTLQPLTRDLADELGVKASRGVVVTDVDPAGAAAEAGVQSGDVIEQINGQAVADAASVRSQLTARRDGRPSLLLVNRHGQHLFLTLGEDRG